ncbi:MAG: diphosphatase [Clostridia bacterium]|jgi:NAD+ diphosphatase|nr:diphosphatase [Clostridia bacterium]
MAKQSIYKRYITELEPKPQPGECSYWFIFCKDRLLVEVRDDKAELPYRSDLDGLKVSLIRTRHLGRFNEQPCYVAEIESGSIPPDMRLYELRALYYAVDFDIFLLAGKAFQIINWDKTHQFCGRCGSKMNEVEKEIAKICPRCGLINYTRISPAVITAIFKEDKILLAHSAAFKGKLYSLIAGFVEPGETLEDGVRREIMEEVGLSVKNIKYFGSQAWPFSSSLMVGYTAEYESGEITVDHNEITDADWFDVNNLPELPAEYSIAREMINVYINRF